MKFRLQGIKLLGLGILLGLSILLVNAYDVQLWSPVQYIKQLFLTPNGEFDKSKATIVLDGTNGTIEAKNVKVNGKDVATKDYVNSKINNINFEKVDKLWIGTTTNWWFNQKIDGYDFGIAETDGAALIPLHKHGTEYSDLRLYILDNENDKFSIWGYSCFSKKCRDINNARNIATFVSNGNVGIGTTNPQAKLDVRGEAIVDSLKIRDKLYLYRDGGYGIHLITPSGKEYSLNISNISHDRRICSLNDMLCIYSPSNGGDAILQIKLPDIKGSGKGCVLVHVEDDMASSSKGLYYAVDYGNDCAVYTNKWPCMKISREGNNKDVFARRAEYKIICF